MSPADAPAWRVTHAHQRAFLVSAAGLGAALLWQRPDLLVLVTPVLVVLVWSTLDRPRDEPAHRAQLTRPVVTEGDRGLVVARVETVRGAEVVAVSVHESEWVRPDPPHGAVVHVVTPEDRHRGHSRVAAGVLARRWGTHRAGPLAVGAISAWGGFRWGPVVVGELSLRALPRTTGFDVTAPAPHPRGLVGLHRAARPGDGSEFRSIRPFQWGDRLKRIHWPRSLRTQELHVTSSYAEEDTHVAVIVDAHYDLGRSGGVDGPSSSLDLSVRAAATVAEHFLHQGDRVSLQVWSSRTPSRVPVGTGRRHHRRILETLAATVPAPQEREDHPRVRSGLGPGTLVVIVSALISPTALTRAAVLSRSGLSVLVIDPFVADVAPPVEEDEIGELAWRVRMLERDREVRRIQQEGVPVVAWRGAGSLDEVLRRMAFRGPRGRVG